MNVQAVVHVYRPRYLSWLGHGVVHRLGHATNGIEEHWGLRTLRALCTQDGDLVTLRLQPRRLGVHALCACLAAALASVRRHGRHTTRTPVAPILALAPTEPTRVRALGLFHRDRPDALLAFAAAQRDGEVAEYLSAGSIDDPELRKHPFNHWLLWELASWARANGARHLDLGGISEGGPDDPLAGITSFKRHFTQNEVEVGRELVAVLRPAVQAVSRAVRRIARD